MSDSIRGDDANRSIKETEDERDEIAREIHAGQDEDDCLFWADVNDRGVLTVGSYMAGFFFDESTNDSA